MSKQLLEYFNGDELAASVWLNKYALQGEKTPDDMHRRMAKEFARIEKNYMFESKTSGDATDLSNYGKSRSNLTEEKIYNLLKDFKYIIPQGSIMSQLGNTEQIGSLSNCFVVGQPEDSYGGIFEKDQQLAQLMKRRGGVGIDISTLRPDRTPTSNAAGTSTGAVSFMERFSNTTREVAQNGRRGALMISIDVRHPDVEAFANIKRDLTKVTGANISVFLRDDFMQAVENDSDYYLSFPCDTEEIPLFETLPEYDELVEVNGIYWKRVKAKKLYDTIIESAWMMAEPGLMFIDKFHSYDPCSVYPRYKGVTTNPCAEIFMQKYDACRLLAMNLFSMVGKPFTSESFINWELLYQIAYEQQRLADDIVDLEIEKIEEIIEKIKSDSEPWEVKQQEFDLWTQIKNVAESGRRTGCGITGLGDMLAAIGLQYDSDEALEIIDKVFRVKMLAELDCTIDLAILRGTFTGWDEDKEYGFIEQDEITTSKYGNEFYLFLYQKFPQQTHKMMKYGRRNVSWSTVAPTGTVSLMTQTTSGLEPLFMPFYMRRKKVNPGEDNVRVDFVDQNGDSWEEYAVLHPKFGQWLSKTYTDISDLSLLSNDTLNMYFEKSPWYGATANDIDWTKRVEIQSIIQKYTTHSISSTINLPNDVTKEEVATIYTESWKQGLKGVTVYRDGCRTGVLVNTETENKDSFEQNDAPKRPKELPCEIHHLTTKGEKFTVIVGLFDSKPYEVFAIPGELAKGYTNGFLEKRSKGKYQLISAVDSLVPVIPDFNLRMTDTEAALTRMISTSLRHGADVKFIVEQLNKTDGDIQSFSKAIARTLKKYIPDGTVSTLTKLDPECEKEDCNVIFEEGCVKCTSCGYSKCG